MNPLRRIGHNLRTNLQEAWAEFSDPEFLLGLAAIIAAYCAGLYVGEHGLPVL